jgi:serine/threonine-protein kinase
MTSDDHGTADLLAEWAAQPALQSPEATEAWLRRHPEHAEDLRVGIALVRALGGAAKAGIAARSEPDSALTRLAPEMRPSEQPPLLRDVGGGRAPVLTPAPGVRGRYQVVGEVARGGIGVILKGRDVDLGRDVALKTLQDELADDPVHVQRLVEEAQIGGQLQHPGIVPVYELGVDLDARPYFAMKLVQGKTLASLLTERWDRPADSARFLAIFGSVCQAVAYAHARGVIHRDLKPANVMVGDFGEVLVVDWGMGKVLRQGGVADESRARGPRADDAGVKTRRSSGEGTPSVVGSMMGTPTYMSPEQARGEIDDLDERTDVFALGGILCEILTGSPPYAGSLVEILRRAAEGDVSEARERLARSGADATLVALASECLAVAPQERPRDAGRVAARIAAYTASLEEKRRQAEAEAARASLRAEEERKRRRLSVALAACVLGLVLVGGGAWYWRESDQRRRSESVRGEVGAALEETARSRALAGAEPSDLRRWFDAVAASRRAEVLARSPDAEPAVRDHAREVLREVEAESAAAEAAVRKAEAGRSLQARLEEVRQSRGVHFDTERAVREYRDALRERGVDPENEDVAALAERVAASPARSAIVLALSEWRRFERALRHPTDRLDAVLDVVDADPLRRRLRVATSLDELKALAAEADVAGAAPESLLALVSALGASGDPTGAADLSERVRARHPGDFWANWTAGSWAAASTPPRAEAAVRFYTAAIALRPESFSAHINLGVVLLARGDKIGALAEFQEMVRLRPDYPQGHNNLGLALRALGHADEAIAALRKAVEIEPTYVQAWNELGLALRDKGLGSEAIAAHRKAVEMRPDLAYPHVNLGIVLRESGDPSAAIAEYEKALAIEPDLVAALTNLGSALGDKGDLDRAIEVLNRAIELDPGFALAHNNLGHMFRAKGEHERAIAAWRKAIALDPGMHLAHFNLGVALRDQGKLDEAMVAWRKALELRPRFSNAHNNLGVALFLKGDHAGAVAAFRKVVEIDPRDAEAFSNLGSALSATGALEEAIASYREALRLRPSLVETRKDLVKALTDAGRHEEARAAEVEPAKPDGR